MSLKLSVIQNRNKTYLSFWNCWAGGTNTDMIFLHKFSVIFSAITEMIVYFFDGKTNQQFQLYSLSKWISDKSKKICQIVTVESSNFSGFRQQNFFSN